MIGGQLELDLGRVLLAAEDERLDDRAQPFERVLVAGQLDRPGEGALEPLARAEQPRVDDVHDRPELAEPVLDRRAGHRELPPRGQPPERPGALGGRVLDVLRLVEEQPVPGDPGEGGRVARGDVVGGDDHVTLGRQGDEPRPREPADTVMEVNPQRGREPLDLGAPLADDAHRADDERRPELLRRRFLALGDEHRDRLHRLPEAHVVGQDPAHPEVAEQPQPAVTALLEREEVELHRGRSGEGAEAPVAVAQELCQGRVEGHVAELEAGLVCLEPRDRPDELHDPGARPAPLEELQRPLHVGLAERVPAAGHADERLLGGDELGELGLGEGDVADREAPVEAGERRRREEAARPDRRPARRRQVDAEAARSAQPRGREEHRHAEPFELWDGLAEEGCDRPGLELHLGGLGAQLDSGLRQQRLELGEPADQVAARVTRPQEGEDAVLAVPDERGREPERRVVLRPEPEFEHEGGRAVRCRPLVELERELPRRRREPAEPVVDPAGEAPLERGVAAVPRQHGLGGGQALEEELERARPAVQRGAREPHAGGAEPVARDLVDEDGVEIVDGRVAVAAERARRDRGERGRDPGQRRLHALVERRAPEGVPPAVAVVEMGVDEPLGDRPARELDEREDPAGAVAELGGSGICELAELADVEPAPCGLACAGKLEPRGQPEPEAVVGERAVAGPPEDVGACVVLPDDLERCCGRALDGLDRLWF